MAHIVKCKLLFNVKLSLFSYSSRQVTLGLTRQKALLFLAINAYTLAACSCASPSSVSRWVPSVSAPSPLQKTSSWGGREGRLIQLLSNNLIVTNAKGNNHYLSEVIRT